MNKVSTQQVILFLGITFILMAGVVTLIAMDKDVGVILAIIGMVVTPILVAAGASVVQRVDTKLENLKEATNGDRTQLVELLRETKNQLAELALKKEPNGGDQEVLLRASGAVDAGSHDLGPGNGTSYLPSGKASSVVQ